MVGLPGERAGAGSGAAGEGDAVEAVRVPWGDPATDGRPHFEDWVRARPSLMLTLGLAFGLVAGAVAVLVLRP